MTSEKCSPQDGLAPGEETITRIWATPVTVKGISWIPLTQLAAWGIFSRSAARQNPEKSWPSWIWEGFLKMTLALGSEWGHNLAHLAVSNLIGKPMDQLRIQLGMPRCIYHELNDRTVESRQHVVRSLGGPLFNLLLLPLAGLGRFLASKGSLSARAAKTAWQANLFLSLVSLLPIPGIDGGPILKWSLIERGSSVAEADQIVRRVNGPLALALGLFSSRAFARQKHLTGWLGLLLGLTSLSIFAGWLKEENVKI